VIVGNYNPYFPDLETLFIVFPARERNLLVFKGGAKRLEEQDFQKGIRLEDYISKSQAAEIFKKTSRTIQNWIDEGKFPGALKVAGQWFIPKSDINLALEIKEVIPMRQDMSKADLIFALEALIEKRDTDLANSMALIIRDVQEENLKIINEIRHENQELRQELAKFKQEQEEKVPDRDAWIVAKLRELTEQKKPWWQFWK